MSAVRPEEQARAWERVARRVLESAALSHEQSRDGLAALSALVADRDEWEATAEELGKELKRSNENRHGLEADRDTLAAQLVALAGQVTELRAALERLRRVVPSESPYYGGNVRAAIEQADSALAAVPPPGKEQT